MHPPKYIPMEEHHNEKSDQVERPPPLNLFPLKEILEKICLSCIFDLETLDFFG